MGWEKEQQKILLQLQIAQLQKANAPDPYLEKLKGINSSIIDWHTNPNNTVKDIYKHPTLGGQLPIFQLARQQRDVGRMGRGIAGLGDKFNPQYAKELQIEDSTNRNMYASGMLEQGLQGELGKAESDLSDLVTRDSNRNNASNALYGPAMKQLEDMKGHGWGSFFKGVLQGAIKSGAQIGMGFLTGGGSMLGGGGGGMFPDSTFGGQFPSGSW